MVPTTCIALGPGKGDVRDSTKTCVNHRTVFATKSPQPRNHFPNLKNKLQEFAEPKAQRHVRSWGT